MKCEYKWVKLRVQKQQVGNVSALSGLHRFVTTTYKEFQEFLEYIYSTLDRNASLYTCNNINVYTFNINTIIHEQTSI